MQLLFTFLLHYLSSLSHFPVISRPYSSPGPPGNVPEPSAALSLLHVLSPSVSLPSLATLSASTTTSDFSPSPLSFCRLSISHSLSPLNVMISLSVCPLYVYRGLYGFAPSLSFLASSCHAASNYFAIRVRLPLFSLFFHLSFFNCSPSLTYTHLSSRAR